VTEKAPSELRLTYNGWWSKLTLMVVGGVCTSIVLGGLGGIIVTLRSQDQVQLHVRQDDERHADHENRIRAIEARLSEINTGVQVLLERTMP
jgi:hypothetical protein